MKRNLITGVLLSVCILFFMLFFFSGDLCLVRRVFGIPCPGCGMTRAYLHLFHFDLAGAFFFHPLFWTVPLAALVVVFRRYRFFQTLYQSSIFWTVLAVLFVGVYLLRMILLFPDTAPMDYNDSSVLMRLFSTLK